MITFPLKLPFVIPFPENMYYPNNPSPKVTMRIQIKLTKCEEIGIFCRNIAEKFILKFAKLFYIKKTRGFMPFSSTICDFYNKKLKF